jgi:hypothetical protein
LVKGESFVSVHIRKKQVDLIAGFGRLFFTAPANWIREPALRSRNVINRRTMLAGLGYPRA